MDASEQIQPKHLQPPALRRYCLDLCGKFGFSGVQLSFIQIRDDQTQSLQFTIGLGPLADPLKLLPGNGDITQAEVCQAESPMHLGWVDAMLLGFARGNDCSLRLVVVCQIEHQTPVGRCGGRVKSEDLTQFDNCLVELMKIIISTRQSLV